MGIKHVCIFLIRLYIKAWFCCPVAAKAPFQDLNFLKDLYYYKNTHKVLSCKAFKKFCGHLWYLSDESIALALYDTDIPLATKIELVKAIQVDKNNEDTLHNVKKVIIHEKDVSSYINQPLQYFASLHTMNFFKRFNIPCEFLKSDPYTWDNLEDYQKGNLKVVNDTAERGVKLMEEFNKSLTKKEDQIQFIFQVVKNYRKKFPDCSKKTLLSNM